MDHNASKPLDKEKIIAAIRAAVEENGGERIRMEAFLERAKIRKFQFNKFFTGWRDALRAAGFDFDVRGERVPEERLLADWGEVARKIQLIPTVMAYNIHGNYNSATLSDRFSSFRNVPSAFEKFAKEKTEWADVLAICADHHKRDRRSGQLARRERQMRMRPEHGDGTGQPGQMCHSAMCRPVYGLAIPDRQLHGDPLLLPGLGYAPVNESGVVYLFGMIGWRLGFHVELLRPFFPDCEAQRQIGPGQWQRVTIEFEYESRNFSLHAHDPKGCDIIVCWRHNWEDCPNNLEVITLGDELKRLAPGTQPGCYENA